MITLDMVNRWLSIPRESEHLEFKEAQRDYSKNKIFEYCVAFANEGGGHLILGVTDKLPRKVVGTQAFTNIDEIKLLIYQKLHFHVEVCEFQQLDGRVLVFAIPKRPIGQPQHLDGTYWMRSGGSLVPMSPDRLRAIILEGESSWLFQAAKKDCCSEDVIALLDTQAYFDLMKVPYPTTRDSVLVRLVGEKLIAEASGGWVISNLAALLFAKHLDAFSTALARKAPRVVIYNGVNKLQTHEDTIFMQGYVVAFERLVDFVHSAAPKNHYVEQAVREEVKMFPKQALRELIANALIHQDFLITGTSIMIEMYSDRVEIASPGIPPICVERFIDEYRSLNEVLADLMRRLGICEEKGSGIDKVVHAAEVFQLPAPDFKVGELRTTAVLFTHQDFSSMSKQDRIRACYQHCCLQYVSNQRMSNQTLRERFKLPESSVATVSQVIGFTKDTGLIKPDDTETNSTRYARYLPFWA